MSSPVSQPARKSAERPKYAPQPGGRMFGSPAAVEKSINFGPSLRRLIGHLRPEALIMILVIGLAVAGIVMSVIGPKIPSSSTPTWRCTAATFGPTSP